MDVLNAMQVFVSVVETGSFTNAAQSLQMHRPAVSKSIQLLEQRLDGRLLNRSTRRLSMTAEGEAFYHRCKAILDNVGQAMASLGDRPARLVGKLRVDLPVSVGHLLIIPTFRDALTGLWHTACSKVPQKSPLRQLLELGQEASQNAPLLEFIKTSRQHLRLLAKKSCC